MIRDYFALQNGSDIRGVAMGSAEKITLDGESAGRLASGFLYMLMRAADKPASEITIAVGRDSRLTGEALESAVCGALAAHGANVLSCGLASTPAMFMSTVFPEFSCSGAIMITASHMPRNRNGLKFFDAYGGLDKDDITDIINFAESDQILATIGRPQSGPTKVMSVDLMGRYAKHLRKIIIDGCNGFENSIVDKPAPYSDNCALDKHDDKPLRGLRITVDAGNGAGGFYATEVLGPLGADVSSSQYLEPDGNFPNHIPNPENTAAMDSIRQAVLRSGADLGLIFDTDVDRASAVDERGREINKNGIVALAAALIAKENPGTTVVTDSVTSPSLTSFLTGLGLKHLRYKRGYRNVINKAIELNEAGTDSALAIETSGHAAYRENYFLDDGAYLAAKIVIRTARLKANGKHISSVISDLSAPAESCEHRLPIIGPDFAAVADSILSCLEESVRSGIISNASLELPNYEGVRIKFTSPNTDGWLLIRKSLHEPIMPVNIESDVAGGCSAIKDILRPYLGNFPSLDISSF